VLLPPGPLLMTLRLLHVLSMDAIKEDVEVNTMLCRVVSVVIEIVCCR